MLNVIHLIGHLGADPKVMQTKNDLQIVKLRIATSHPKKVGDRWEKETDWHNVTIFGNRGNFFRDYARKGSLASITGRVSNTTSTSEDGQTRYHSDVIASETILLEPKSSTTSSPTHSDKFNELDNEAFSEEGLEKIPF